MSETRLSQDGGAGFRFGTQYFRPPFPRAQRWPDDLRRIRDAGLDTIVCWLPWGWCEPQPGRWAFDDYDRLLDLAERNGLGAVFSLLPELNPYWVPRRWPQAMMVDVHGRAATPGPRLECLSGVVPGGCSDHSGVREHMRRFLQACGEHFRGRDPLIAWDVWNENRWRNGIDGSACFCESSRASQLHYLRAKYGSLESLGDAWGRRYEDWADVRFGPEQSNCYPERHDFLGWLSFRNSDMIRWRLEALRRGDPARPAGSHTSSPSICGGVALKEDLFARGIDSDVARGSFYGLSLFPDMNAAGPLAPVDLAARLTATASAAGDRPYWLSEVQGGPVVMGGEQSPPLEPARQQAWVWLAVSRGAGAAIFWCWEPEVFGIESGGFGVRTPDGLADARVAAIRQTAQQLKASGVAQHGFTCDPPQVGVVFQRDGYWRHWMRSREYAPRLYEGAEYTLAYLRALERLNIPYVVLDDHHPDRWSEHPHLRLVIAPDADSLADVAADRLLALAAGGGAVWVEGAPGRFGGDTFLRDSHDWPLCRPFGAEQAVYRRTQCIRRRIEAGSLNNAEPIEVDFDLHEVGWTVAGQARHEALGPEPLPVFWTAPHGRGRVAVIGSAVGGPTWAAGPQRLVRLVAALADWSGVQAEASITASASSWCTVRRGRIGDRPALLLINFGPGQQVAVDWAGAAEEAGHWRASGRALPVRHVGGRLHATVDLGSDEWLLLTPDPDWVPMGRGRRRERTSPGPGTAAIPSPAPAV